MRVDHKKFPVAPLLLLIFAFSVLAEGVSADIIFGGAVFDLWRIVKCLPLIGIGILLLARKNGFFLILSSGVLLVFQFIPGAPEFNRQVSFATPAYYLQIAIVAFFFLLCVLELFPRLMKRCKPLLVAVLTILSVASLVCSCIYIFQLFFLFKDLIFDVQDFLLNGKGKTFVISNFVYQLVHFIAARVFFYLTGLWVCNLYQTRYAKMRCERIQAWEDDPEKAKRLRLRIVKRTESEAAEPQPSPPKEVRAKEKKSKPRFSFGALVMLLTSVGYILWVGFWAFAFSYGMPSEVWWDVLPFVLMAILILCRSRGVALLLSVLVALVTHLPDLTAYKLTDRIEVSFVFMALLCLGLLVLFSMLFRPRNAAHTTIFVLFVLCVIGAISANSFYASSLSWLGFGFDAQHFVARFFPTLSLVLVGTWTYSLSKQQEK